MISITINGKTIGLDKPVTVLEAASQAGIHIPHFCSHPLLESFGGCRMCLVEVENMPRLQASCTLMAADGMSVRTESPEVVKARKAMLEFLLINHPLECPTCDKAGECRLQNYTVLYGAEAGRFEEKKRMEPESLEDPLIVRNMERCIMCTRCVRMCDAVQGASAISPVGRGGRTFIEPFSGGRYECEYCGNCIVVCPVGSIMSRMHRYEFRPWQVEQEAVTICSYCGVGCSMVVQAMQEKIERVKPRPSLGTNNGLLCARGFFGHRYVESPRRLETPLVREKGRLRQASWDEALELVAKRLRETRDRSGGGSIAGIASARCTNEDNYLFQKLMRAGLKSNNVDSIARMGYAPAQRILDALLGPGSTSNIISGIAKSDAVLVAGDDPTSINPVLGIQIRMALRNGAKVITLGYAPGLRRHSTTRVPLPPRSEGVALGALLGEVLRIRRFPRTDPALEKEISDLPLPSIEETGAGEDLKQALRELLGASAVSVVAGRGLMAQEDGASNHIVLAGLAYMLNARVYIMSEGPNEQGAVDVGCMPEVFAGGRPVSLKEERERFERAWGEALPAEEGLTLMEMVETALTGNIKAMYVMGENPAFNLPDSSLVRDAIGGLEFLVVQDIFLTETAELAHVVLPAMAWGEKDGTFTNLERRVQRVRGVLKGKGMEDWRIVSEVGKRLGLKSDYGSAEGVFDEMASLSPIYSGLSYGSIDKGYNLWPYMGFNMGGPPWAAPRQEILKHYRKPSVPSPSPLSLELERPLFHSGTMSRESAALNSIHPMPEARMGPATARALSLTDGDPAEISTSRGKLTIQARVVGGIPEGVIFLTNNFKNTGVFFLFEYNILSYGKTPVTGSAGLEIKRGGKWTS